MGLFDKLFGKEAAKEPAPVCEPMTVYAPAGGTVIPLEQFPDEMFSQEVLGPGCGIQPSGDTVTAPFNGEVSQVVDTMHAIGVMSSDGLEVLIHVGVDTVEMNGKGFRTLVKQGQKVNRGCPLISFDRREIEAAGHPDAIAVIVTNGDEFSGVELIASGEIAAGNEILRIKK